MPVLGLDLSSTCTGWALWRDDDTFATGRIKPKVADFDALAWRRLWIAAQVVELIDAHHPDLVIVEGVPTHGAHSIVPLAKLHGVVLDRLVPLGIRPAEYDPSKLKKFATGNGNAKKTVVLNRARDELGYAGASTDEAEALWLALVGSHLVGGVAHSTPQRHALLAGVAWPEGQADPDPTLATAGKETTPW